MLVLYSLESNDEVWFIDKNMTAKTFLHDLRRGLGSAIRELQTNPDRARYRDIVLRCCLKDIGYDIQAEGTKGYYLYSAICALGVEDEFEDILIDAFMKRLEHDLFQQLADILCLYADDGSEKAKMALCAKYENLAERLSQQKTFPPRYGEREQFEYLMIYEVDTHTWPGFKKCVMDAGRIIIKRNDDACNHYDWFLDHSQDVLSKERIAKYFSAASEKSAEVNALVTATEELEKTWEEHSRSQVEPNVTLERYVAWAEEIAEDASAYMRMRKAALHFSRQGKHDDFLKLISLIANERSDGIRANLLRVFKFIDFPADIDVLIKYAESDCERIKDISVDALERFADNRVHDAAIKFIVAGDLDAGLPLLIKNWRKQDEPLIRKQVLSSKKVSHSLQLNIQAIYSQHRSKSCGDILEHIYKNGECAFCRSGIVENMWKNRVLKESILEECLYDSYYETRKLAERIQNRIG